MWLIVHSILSKVLISTTWALYIALPSSFPMSASGPGVWALGYGALVYGALVYGALVYGALEYHLAQVGRIVVCGDEAV